MEGTSQGNQVHATSIQQDAVRLLFLISAAASPLTLPLSPDAPQDAVSVLRSQKLLQKLDFWLRNPDYLADEMLTRFEQNGDREDLRIAQMILDSEEPEIRSYPMLRHWFGAYEPLDQALAVLRTPGLVIRRKNGSSGHTTQHDYYLTKRGQETVEHITRKIPALRYYSERTTLVNDLAAGRRGNALADIQYLQPEYADAAMGSRIAGIAARARKRLATILESESTVVP